MKRLIAVLAGVLLGSAAMFVAPQAASAATNPIAVESKCHEGWYVNPDEGSLLPKQKDDGFEFDGPSLVHHVTSYTLASTPTDGSFAATVQTGVAPLFKMETTSPYSTVNKTPAGKYWSSKINASDAGGMDNPVDSPADLVDKPLTKTLDLTDKYTATTKVFSFGVGYANDTGNKALVKSIKFADKTYDLSCKVTPSSSPTATPSSTGATPTPSKTTALPSSISSPTPVAGEQLPTTGNPTLLVALFGAVLILAGVIGIVLSRRRRARFEAS